MKKGIHPSHYRTVLFYNSSAKAGWLIRSCAETRTTLRWEDGQDYPVVYLDTSSASHPAYTGKQREHSGEGRASQFMARYGKRLPGRV